MANNYVDQYGRYHHKPVTEANPIPSNNSWIYTAYAHEVGLSLNLDWRAAVICASYLTRHPEGNPFPPISRDEILGLAHLGFIRPHHLKDWNFSPYKPVPFELPKFVKQLIELVKHSDDRNYFWKNNLDQIYRFAFSVPLTDRHFILQKWGKFNVFYWAIAKVDSYFGKDSGIRYLKYGKSKEAMLEEFPLDHPIRSL